jgi:hypothetical protein
MKTKRLGLISCFAAAALIASPALGDMHTKSAATSMSKPQRMAARSTQVTPTYRHGISSRMGTAGYYAGSRNDTSYAGYYGGNRYYYGGGFGYPVYGSYSYWPYGYSGYNPYSYYGGYPDSYSYYQPAHGYDAGTVAAVQRRLGELGYYHGVLDGVMGPRTRAAIAAYESRHGLVVDGTISTPLLDRLGLA